MRKLLTVITAAAAALMLCSCSLLRYDSSEENSQEGYIIPAEFTEDDLYIQGLLDEATNLITDLYSVYGNEVMVEFARRDTDGYDQKTYMSSHLFGQKKLDNERRELKKYFTGEAIELFEKNYAVAYKDGFTWQYDGTRSFTVTAGSMFDENGSLKAFPHLMNVDGELLCGLEEAKAADALNDCFWSTAHVTDKTDDEIRFAYIVETDGTLTERTGILKNEDGWKLSWYMVGINMKIR